MVSNRCTYFLIESYAGKLSAMDQGSKIVIQNNLPTEVDGTVFFRVWESVNFNVSKIVPKPYTSPPSGRVPVTLPVGFEVKIVNITAAEERLLGRKCEPLLSPAGRIFGVINNNHLPLACEIVNLEPGTCSPLADAAHLVCRVGVNNCNPGFEPKIVKGKKCPCRCEKKM